MYQVEQNLIMHNRLTEHSATLEQDVTLVLKRFNIPCMVQCLTCILTITQTKNENVAIKIDLLKIAKINSRQEKLFFANRKN